MPTESKSGAITIRGWRGRLRFDDQGITVENFFRVYRIEWAEVHQFADGYVWPSGENGPGTWALAVVRHDGSAVTAGGTAAKWAAPSETLVAVGQAAQRHGIPAELTGTIDRDSFPVALLGASATIRVTARYGHDDREAILDVIERTEPVQPRDILTLSHHGTDVEVQSIRQIFAGGRWEQVALVRDVL